MASGDPVVEVLKVLPPASSGATLDVRVGGNTPNEVVEVWDFDAASIEYLDFVCRLSEDYDGGGITIAPGASDPYPLFGAGNEVDLAPGMALTFSFVGVGSGAPAVSSSVKTIDISGTEGDALDVLVLLGT